VFICSDRIHYVNEYFYNPKHANFISKQRSGGVYLLETECLFEGL
jgi:hypothetical protein